MLSRLWHTAVRAVLIGSVLFPMWIAYVLPWLRMHHWDETIPAEVWAKKHARHASRFYRLATRLRGGLIKVGQILSTRVDLLPPEWTTRLSGLQDRVEPAPWATIEAHLRRAYGDDFEERFERLDREAIAAASFGQVHRARTKDGREVALKIKYPDVDRMLAIDMWILGIAVRLFNVFLPKISLGSIYGEVRRSLTQELDYAQEARFTRIIHASFEGREDVVIPAVVEELTTGDVICTTWFTGKKITDPAILEDPALDRRLLLERLLSTWIQMMYVDGVFQSDPHPGNLLVRIEDGEPILGVVDFGQVMILPQAFHQKLVASVMAFAMGNVDMFVDALVSIGLFSASDVERARPIVAGVMTRLRDQRPVTVDELDFAKVKAEVKDALDHIDGVVVPQELVLYGRTFALLAGVSRAIAPDVNALAVARPLVTQALLAGGPPERPIEEREKAA